MVPLNALINIPYHTIPYHTIPYHTIPYHTIPYHTIPYHTIPYHTIPYHTIPYHTIPYHTTPHTIHQFIAGASVNSHEPYYVVAEVYRYFVSKRFINQLRNMPDTHCYAPQCIYINSQIINDHLQAKNSCVSRVLNTRFALRHHQDTSSYQNSILFFFLILWLFNFSVLLLLLAFASSCCLIY